MALSGRTIKYYQDMIEENPNQDRKTILRGIDSFHKPGNQTQFLPTASELMRAGQRSMATQENEAALQKEANTSGDFVTGLNRGIQQTQGMFYGGAALAGSAAEKMGLEDTGQAVKDWGVEGYRRNMEEAGEYKAKNSFKDIYTGKAGVGGAIDWAQGTLGELIPSMATAAVGTIIGTMAAPGVGSATGAFASRTILKKSIEKLTEKAMESGLKGMTKAQLKKEITKKALMKLGGKVGMGAAVMPMEAGGMYAGLLEDHGIDAPGTALLFGAAATALEYAGGNSNSIDGMVDAIAKGSTGMIKKTAKELLKNVPEEAMQEGGQEFFSILNTVVNTDEKLLTVENLEQIIESAAAGAIGGGAGAAMSGILSKDFDSNDNKNDGAEDPSDAEKLMMDKEDLGKSAEDFLMEDVIDGADDVRAASEFSDEELDAVLPGEEGVPDVPPKQATAPIKEEQGPGSSMAPHQEEKAPLPSLEPKEDATVPDEVVASASQVEEPAVQEKSDPFSVGSPISWTTKSGKKISGQIQNIGEKTVTVLADDGKVYRSSLESVKERIKENRPIEARDNFQAEINAKQKVKRIESRENRRTFLADVKKRAEQQARRDESKAKQQARRDEFKAPEKRAASKIDDYQQSIIDGSPRNEKLQKENLALDLMDQQVNDSETKQRVRDDETGEVDFVPASSPLWMKEVMGGKLARTEITNLTDKYRKQLNGETVKITQLQQQNIDKYIKPAIEAVQRDHADQFMGQVDYEKEGFRFLNSEIVAADLAPGDQLLGYEGIEGTSEVVSNDGNEVVISKPDGSTGTVDFFAGLNIVAFKEGNGVATVDKGFTPPDVVDHETPVGEPQTEQRITDEPQSPPSTTDSKAPQVESEPQNPLNAISDTSDGKTSEIPEKGEAKTAPSGDQAGAKSKKTVPAETSEDKPQLTPGTKVTRKTKKGTETGEVIRVHPKDSSMIQIKKANGKTTYIKNKGIVGVVDPVDDSVKPGNDKITKPSVDPKTKANKKPSTPTTQDIPDGWEKVPGGSLVSTFAGGKYLISGGPGQHQVTNEETGKVIGGTHTYPQRAANKAHQHWVESMQRGAGETVEKTEVTLTNQGKLAAWVTENLSNKKPMKSSELIKKAVEVYGEPISSGKHNIKDVYDAAELGINQFILNSGRYNPGTESMSLAEKNVNALASYTKLLPTQTNRTKEQIEYQQFSTPPAFAYIASWVSNAGKGDIVLEPSAGIGGLAIFPKKAGAKVYVNELSERRSAFLKEFGFDGMFAEDAAQLDNILPQNIKPTVVIMNPPFSSTAGRTSKNKTMNGAKHIEQALARLEENGRLVAIVGQGMNMKAPHFQTWWDKIKGKYNVRANIGVNGKEYAKYGTTFDNQLLVIDKTGPTTDNIITGKVESFVDLLPKLQGIKEVTNDNKAVVEPSEKPEQDSPDKPKIGESPKDSKGTDSGRSPVLPPTDVVGDGKRGGSTERDDGISDTETDGSPSEKSVGSVELGGTEKPSGEPKGVSTDTDTTTGRVDRGRSPEPSTPKLKTPVKKQRKKISDAVYDKYIPATTMAGAKPHITPLVESSAMADTKAPTTSYTPNIPQESIDSGKLTDAQLEAITYAGRAHGKWVSKGIRKGFFVGDGTGVGKGREISGVIWDNWRNGRKKAIWLSEKASLLNDAKRDLKGVGWDEGADKVFSMKKAKLGKRIPQKDGILFTQYATLRGKFNDIRLDQPETLDDLNVRLNQIVKWAGKDFDGVIAFDEAHNMGNVIPMKGKRGVKKPASQALAGVMLQKMLPKARIVYVSATGATEVQNLAYAERLGLWGEGTPFKSALDFVSKISGSGISAMELVARDIKSLGLYIARSLSYEGVKYDRIEHELSPEQTKIYDKLATAWQTVLANIDDAIEVTDGGSKARAAALSQFWGSHQRFFNQIMTAMQMPSTLTQIQKDIDAGKAVVLQLTNTNASQTDRKISAMGEDMDIEDLDMTPRESLMQFLEKSFPTKQYEKYEDENGVERTRVVVDSKGNPIENREAVAMKKRLLQETGSLSVPDTALDMILHTFGPGKVAEVTGRSRRVIIDKKGNKAIQKWSDAKAQKDILDFMDDKKQILIFSEKGGTGSSYHAAMDAKNQRVRRHYLIQPGWRADKAVQGLGRSHRSFQKQPPEFVLVTTNLPGQKRFLSSIARRLDQLGALTKGQRQTGGQGIFAAKDNLESSHAKDALRVFLSTLAQNRYDNLNYSDFSAQTGLKLLDDEGGLKENLPEVTQFLNRLLSMTQDMQNKVFDTFSMELDRVIERHSRMGTLDVGLETLTADSVRKVKQETAYEDKKENIKAEYVQFELDHPAKNIPFKLVSGSGKGFYTNNKSGKIRVSSGKHSRTDSKSGDVVEYVALQNPGRNTSRVDIADLEKKWTKVSKAGAEALWNKEFDALPTHNTETVHLLTGTLLPLWDKLDGRMAVARLETDNGERFLGRKVDPQSINQVLDNLGMDKEQVKMSPAKMVDNVLAGGSVTLDNETKLKRSKVSGEDRIEYVDTGRYSSPNPRQMEGFGLFSEQIQWKTRWFVPTGDAATGVIEKIMKGRAIESVQTSVEKAQYKTTTTPTKSNKTITPEKVKKYFKDRNLQTGTTKDGKLWVRTPRGLGFTVETVDQFSDAEYQIAINSGAMGKDGHIAGNLVDHNIKVSTEFGDGKTLDHELVHFLENAGILTKKELTILDNNIKMRRGLGKGSKFKIQIDGRESRANYLSEILANREQFRGTALGNVLQKVADFLDALYQIARETMGKYRNSDRQIARGMETGSIYNRDGVAAQSQEESPLYQSKRNTETPAFKKWFGKSVVTVDGEVGSEPLQVFHGTRQEFDEFDDYNIGDNNVSSTGFMFIDNLEEAEFYTEKEDLDYNEREGDSPRVISAYLTIEKPLEVDSGSQDPTLYHDEFHDKIKKESIDYDGVIISGNGNTVYIAFNPTQIKSVDNKGTWSQTDPRIQYSITNKIKSRFSSKKKDPGYTRKAFEGILSEDVTTRMQASRGVKKESWLDKLRDYKADMVREMDHFPELTRMKPGKERSSVREILRRHQDIPEVAQTITQKKMKDILRGLSKEDADLFAMELILGDEVRSINDGLRTDENLPFGFKTTSEVIGAHKKLQAKNKKNPRVTKALRTRRKFQRDLAKDLVKYKIMRKEILKDGDYFHHQILLYWNDKANGKNKRMGTSSSEVRTKWRPWMAARKGSPLDYNTEYMEAEFYAMAQQVAQVETAKNLVEIKKENDILPKLKREAKALNAAAYDKWVTDRQQEQPDFKDPSKRLSGQIVAGFNNLAKAAKKGELTYDGAFDGVVRDLITAYDNKLADEEAWKEAIDDNPNVSLNIDNPQLFPFLSHLLEHQHEGRQYAAMVYKGIKGKDRVIKETLGKDFKTWKNVMPEAYKQWKPDPNKGAFFVNSITDQVLSDVLSGEKTLEEKHVRKVLARGQAPFWVIPGGLADTMDNFRSITAEGRLARTSENALAAWKQYILINPLSALKYNANNMSGDLDATLAYRPEIASPARFKAATMDLIKWMKQDGLNAETQAELDRAHKLGVIGSGFSVQEVSDTLNMMSSGDFINDILLEKKPGLVASYWKKAKNITQTRENILRLSAFRWFKEQVDAGNQVYGASKVDDINNLVAQGKKTEVAAKLARELLGDYGNISRHGEYIRKRLIPFYSWIEINAPRYVYMMRNLKHEGESVSGLSLALAKRATVFAAKASMFAGAVMLFNSVAFPDELEELGPAKRRQMHLILGRREDGSIMTLRLQGAFSDALSWFAKEDLPEDIKDLVSGKSTIQEQLADIPKAILNKGVSGIRPEAKMLFETLTGQSTYPDALSTRPVRDKVENVLKTFKMDIPYRYLMGRPQRGGDTATEHFMSDLLNILTYTTEPGVQAYYDTRKLVFDWKKEHGIESGGGKPTKKGNALYYYRQAMKYGDLTAAKKYLQKYKDLGGTRKGKASSIRLAHPLAGIQKTKRHKFKKGLKPAEKKRLEQGLSWYKKTYK